MKASGTPTAAPKTWAAHATCSYEAGGCPAVAPDPSGEARMTAQKPSDAPRTTTLRGRNHQRGM